MIIFDIGYYKLHFVSLKDDGIPFMEFGLIRAIHHKSETSRKIPYELLCKSTDIELATKFCSGESLLKVLIYINDNSKNLDLRRICFIHKAYSVDIILAAQIIDLKME